MKLKVMNEVKYEVSKNYRIIEADKLLSEKEINGIKDEYIIISRVTKRFFLINASIKSFIDFFTEPKTLSEVIKLIEDSITMKDLSIRDTIEKFFYDLCKKQILIPENSYQHINLNNETTIPEMEGYKIQNVFKKRNHIIIASAIDIKNKRNVVLKFLLLQNLQERYQKRVKKDFKQEFEIMSEVNNHPLVCKLVSYDNERMIAELEYIDGVALKSYIVNKIPSLQYRLQIINKLLEVFAFFHGKGVLHGDIHPSNFIINDNIDFKVIDFGLANRVHMRKRELMKGGGVFYYIPPERLSENAFRIVNKSANYKSEVYQLGAVIYFILYGIPPFRENTWKKLAHTIKNGTISFKEKSVCGEMVPPAAIKMLEKALQKDPDKRYTSAIDFYEQWVGLEQLKLV